jgi:mycothiol synthase
VHLADRFDLPAPYTARRYRGREDHPAMVAVLARYREHVGDQELPTVEAMDQSYSRLQGCEPDTDVALVERAGEVVAYARTFFEDLEGGRDCIVFCPVDPAHLTEALFGALLAGQEAHLAPRALEAATARYRGWARHPGPGLAADGEAAWFESAGYVATEWEATLVRPHLDGIPDRPLPEGVEVRPVTPEQVRPIVEAHLEAFRGEWDFHEPTEEDVLDIVDSPWCDESLWQVAWVGDTVVGQVKPFVNAAENAERGRLRGYTEYISTHRDWRNRGIAGALLARSLQALRDRGMTEAALGVDTNNPGGAFHLYTSLGFELRVYEAVYTRPVT